MSNARHVKEMLEIIHDEDHASTLRNKSTAVSALTGKNLLNTLATKITNYPAKDLRLERQYLDSHTVKSTDSEFMVDVAQGMAIKVASKDYQNNMLTINLDFHSNMGEFERYNLVVEQHNDKWIAAGRRKDTFDPIHGDITPVRETLVDQARVQNALDKIPVSRKKGPLASAKPNTKRSTVVTVQYLIKHNLSEFTLGYVARDSNNKVLYYNTLRSPDLTYLVRRSVQELWGNPDVYGDTGPFLEGIAMLINGKKIGICKRDNQKPAFLSGKLKTSNPELVIVKVEQTGLSTLGVVFGNIIPTCCVIGIFVSTILCIAKWGLTGEGGQFIWYMIGFPVCIVISNIIAARINRENSALKMQEKFI